MCTADLLEAAKTFWSSSSGRGGKDRPQCWHRLLLSKSMMANIKYTTNHLLTQKSFNRFTSCSYLEKGNIQAGEADFSTVLKHRVNTSIFKFLPKILMKINWRASFSVEKRRTSSSSHSEILTLVQSDPVLPFPLPPLGKKKVTPALNLQDYTYTYT